MQTEPCASAASRAVLRSEIAEDVGFGHGHLEIGNNCLPGGPVDARHEYFLLCGLAPAAVCGVLGRCNVVPVAPGGDNPGTVLGEFWVGRLEPVAGGMGLVSTGAVPPVGVF